MRSLAALLIFAGALAATGCKPKVVKPPAVVRVPVIQYVPVPAELTAPVPIAEPLSRTVGEAVRVARERKAALEQCNAQLGAIAEIGTKEPSQ